MVKLRRGKDIPGTKSHSITTESWEMMGKVPRVKDIMTSDPVTFTLGTTVHDAAKMLLQKSIVAAPVLDKDGNLVGMFSQQGCMVGLVEGVYHEVPQPIYVDDYMDPMDRTHTTTENAPVMTAVAKFAASKHLILSLPVLRQGKVVGMIARQDVIRAFFKMTAKIPDAKAAILYISGLEKQQHEIEKLR